MRVHFCNVHSIDLSDYICCHISNTVLTHFLCLNCVNYSMEKIYVVE